MFFFEYRAKTKQKRKRRSTIIFFSTSCKHFVRFDAFLRRFGPFWVVLSENCHVISRKIFQKNTVANGKTGKAKRPGATGNSRLGQMRLSVNTLNTLDALQGPTDIGTPCNMRLLFVKRFPVGFAARWLRIRRPLLKV